jgi:hypothetical protein
MTYEYGFVLLRWDQPSGANMMPLCPTGAFGFARNHLDREIIGNRIIFIDSAI